jgi:RNA polymerase sigma-70 factor (ECF subfamily)
MPRRPERREDADLAVEQTLSDAGPLDPDRPSGTASASSRPSQPARFRTLVLPHLDSAYGFARYLCRDAAGAEDIAQDAMLKAFRAFDSYRGGEPKAWLLAIVRNAYFDWARRRRAWETMAVSDPDGAYDVADDAEPGAETILIRQGDAAALRAAIEALPEPFREALVLKDLEELSYRQIAEATGAPIGTVMSRLSRARQMLARAMGVAEPATGSSAEVAR